jgi:hypothetical protein
LANHNFFFPPSGGFFDANKRAGFSPAQSKIDCSVVIQRADQRLRDEPSGLPRVYGMPAFF